MSDKVEHELAKERRNRLIDPNNPSVKELWDGTRAIVEAIAKPGINLDNITEFLLIQSLLFAYKDQLSGLHNKTRALIELDAATAVARKLNIPMSVLFADGKKFKEINDTLGLGHDTGDRVIAAVGEAFARGARRSFDITLRVSEEETQEEPNIETGRYGGDEFIVILLGTDIKGANIVTHNIQQIITQTVDEQVPNYRQILGKGFEVDIGMAQFDPATDKTGRDVLIRADADLNRIRQEQGESRRSSLL